MHSACTLFNYHLLKELAAAKPIDQLSSLDKDVKVMLKLSIPTEDNFYHDLMDNPHIVRVMALSGGYTQSDANERLAHTITN